METKVLIVDDDSWICFYLERFLIRKGYTVHTARNGQEALNLAHRVHPQLILLDLVMPEMDGIETLYALRKSGEQGVVIFITGKDDQDAICRAFELGAYRFLPKPFSLSTLRHIIRDCAELYSDQDNFDPHSQLH